MASLKKEKNANNIKANPNPKNNPPQNLVLPKNSILSLGFMKFDFSMLLSYVFPDNSLSFTDENR